MAIIETKYNVGDVVYHGTCDYDNEYVECPDCLGTKKVHVTFADERIQELDCYTCRSHGYPEYSMGKLSYKTYRASVKSGTISSFKLSDGKVSYHVNFGYETYESGNMREAIYILTECEIFYDISCALSHAEKQLEWRIADELERLIKKKGSFAKRLQESHLGYNRKKALEEERDVNRWVKAIKGK